ncbi:MAG: hypothetical protein JXQ82_06370 [Methanomicrobiaceae archaeon]|nr:hypothetical protein [Methanomicrobiaceae archaeon]
MNFSLDDTEESKIVLYLSDPRKIRESNTAVIKEAQDAGYITIVVTTNFPASILEKLYIKSGIKTESVYFIDAITRYSMGTDPVSDEHHMNTNNPADLTSLGIAITEMMKKLQGNKIFVLMDSISTMLIYLPSVKISQFTHFISTKLRQREESGVLLAVDGGLDPMLLSQMSSFVDEIIEPEKGQ